MIVALAFGAAYSYRGRSVRDARFVTRSTIPVSALCIVANGVREHLRALLGVGVEVMLGEATPLSESARAQLVRRTHCFLTRGRATDVFLFISEHDARRLLSAALGEGPVECDLSPLERSALGRLAHGLADFFDPLCAERHSAPQAVDARQAAACTSYVDLRIGPPIEVTIGIGLTHEPADHVGTPTIAAEQLLSVKCDVRAEIAKGTISAARLAQLAPGEIVRMDTKVGGDAALKVAELVIARGRGGIVVGEDAVSGVAAFAVDSV